jgi:hypothetical protein
MSTSTAASIIVPLPIERVWVALRDFTAICKHVKGIVECKLEEDGKAQRVGVVRVMKWYVVCVVWCGVVWCGAMNSMIECEF